MSTWQDKLRAVALANLDKHPDSLTRTGLAALSEIERADLLRYAVAERIEAAQRDEGRRREVAANLARMEAESRDRQAKWAAERQARREADAVNKRMEQLWQDECWPRLTPWLDNDLPVTARPATSPELIAWLETPAGQRHEQECMERERRIMANLRRQKRQEDALIAEIKREAFMEWTAELLGSKFALGDGTYVTWGSATAEQHEARIALLTKNITGNVETMKRHEAALRTLAESGAACLAATGVVEIERAA